MREEGKTKGRSDSNDDFDNESTTAPNPHESIPPMKLKTKSKPPRGGLSFKGKSLAIFQNLSPRPDATDNTHETQISLILFQICPSK